MRVCCGPSSDGEGGYVTQGFVDDALHVNAEILRGRKVLRPGTVLFIPFPSPSNFLFSATHGDSQA